MSETTMTRWTDDLRALDACIEAVKWADDYESLEAAWAACERGDWMLWYAGRIVGPPKSDRRKRLVLAACACARMALPRVRAGEDRPRVAIETAEAWARGERGVTLRLVRVSADAASASAAYAASASAAYAAACAAYAADASADAASAYAAYAAYAADASADARTRVLKDCADLVRQHYPQPREMFPHQESEFEQESFTRVGRKRVGAVIQRLVVAVRKADRERARRGR